MHTLMSTPLFICMCVTMVPNGLSSFKWIRFIRTVNARPNLVPPCRQHSLLLFTCTSLESRGGLSNTPHRAVWSWLLSLSCIHKQRAQSRWFPPSSSHLKAGFISKVEVNWDSFIESPCTNTSSWSIIFCWLRDTRQDHMVSISFETSKPEKLIL